MSQGAGKWKSCISLFCFSILLMYSFSPAQKKNKETLDIDMFAEFGFFAVLDHKVQFGRDGTYLDYNENGGQDVLFPFTRFSINTQLNRKHICIVIPASLTENFRADRPGSGYR